MELVIALLFAGFCAWIASKKERFAIGWAIAGFLTGIVSLCVLAILPHKSEAKSNDIWVIIIGHIVGIIILFMLLILVVLAIPTPAPVIGVPS